MASYKQEKDKVVTKSYSVPKYKIELVEAKLNIDPDYKTLTEFINARFDEYLQKTNI